jgi:hypothetical protein
MVLTRRGLRLAEQDKGRDDPNGGGTEIYDSEGRHIGWCAYPRLNGSHHARRDHESRRRDKHAYVLPDAAKRVDKDLGSSKDELTLEQFKPEFTRNAKTPTVLPGSRTLISAVPIEENSVQNDEFKPREREWMGINWKACCGYGDHGGKPIRVVTGSEHIWPGNPAFYVFLINRRSERPLLKYGKTDYFRSRLMGYTATSEITVLHLRLWPLWTRKLKFTYNIPGWSKEYLRANFLSGHEKGTTLEQLLESQVKNRIKEDDSINIQLLGGRQQVRQAMADQGLVAPSGKFGNFSEYLDYSKETAIKLQKIVRDSEANFEALGRPMLHARNANWETVRRTLMNSVLDEAPAKVDDVEMFDDYAAQGVMDEIPEVEARLLIPRKKRSETKRRRREVAAPGKRSRRPNVRNFDQ